MSTEVTLPALGESVTEGTVSRWLKEVGDTVEADEALLEVSTDKVDTEIPSPAAGTLLEIRVEADETVEVGAVLAIIGDADTASATPTDQTTSPQSSEGQTREDTPSEDRAPADAAQDDSPRADTSNEGAQAQQTLDDRQNTTAVAEGGDTTSPAPQGRAAGSEVTLPALGESVTEGTVSRWLKEVGDTVEADEALLEVSTDKVDTEIPSPAAGTLLEIRVEADETVEVGAVLAIIGDADAASATPTDQTTSPGTTEPETPAPSDPAGGVGQGDEISTQGEAGAEGGQAPIPAPSATTPPPPQPSTPSPSAPSASAPSASTPAASAAPRASGNTETYVTPLVRKLAEQHGVDLSAITGTGVGGRVRKQDVLTAAEQAKQAAEQATQTAAQETPAAAAPASPAAGQDAARALRGTTEKLTRLRRTIAHRMVESLSVSAQLTATIEVDLTGISRLRRQFKEDFQRAEGAKLSYLPFITKAAVEALKAFPKVNAQVDTDAGEITYADAEHVGIAVDTEKGLIVPVIRDAGDLNIAGLAKKITDLASRTRSNKLSPDDLAGGTFTITNYGSAGTLMDTPIINQPQVAILGTGALVKRPVVITDPNLGDTIVIRDMMYLSMTYDHRIVDGSDAARFLSAVRTRLEGADFAGELGG